MRQNHQLRKSLFLWQPAAALYPSWATLYLKAGRGNRVPRPAKSKGHFDIAESSCRIHSSYFTRYEKAMPSNNNWVINRLLLINQLSNYPTNRCWYPQELAAGFLTRPCRSPGRCHQHLSHAWPDASNSTASTHLLCCLSLQ